jgi:hypothetical protein
MFYILYSYTRTRIIIIIIVIMIIPGSNQKFKIEMTLNDTQK